MVKKLEAEETDEQFVKEMQFTIDHLQRVKAKAIDQAFEKNISA